MPFVNESGNADAEYLSDGMTETLISSLLQLPNLNGKARLQCFVSSLTFFHVSHIVCRTEPQRKQTNQRKELE
jgi:TolB-like protein